MIAQKLLSLMRKNMEEAGALFAQTYKVWALQTRKAACPQNLQQEEQQPFLSI